MLNLNNKKDCACCSGKAYSVCCRPIHQNKQTAFTAEALMRSRFSAFRLGLSDYLLASWCETRRPSELDLTDQPNWFKLVIYKVELGSELDLTGRVEFGAFYRYGEQLGEMREISQFQRNSNGHWCYLSGEILE